MYVIPLYPQPIFHTNPIIHSSGLLFIPPWLPSIPLVSSRNPFIPSHFSHLIPLMEVFPQAPRPSGSPRGPTAPANTTWLKESGYSTGAAALHVQKVTLSDSNVSSWCICVFSSNITNPSSSFSSGKASSSPDLLRCSFGLLIYCVECG